MKKLLHNLVLCIFCIQLNVLDWFISVLRGEVSPVPVPVPKDSGPIG